MDLVLGGSGLVGSAIVEMYKKNALACLYPSSRELNLLDYSQVINYLAANKPEKVYLAAAKVGGILANIENPVPFIENNLIIQTNVIKGCYESGVKKLMFLGSSCIYPRLCKQPMKEEYLMTGPVEPTNEYYAIAKIAGIKMCQAYNKQFGTNYITVIPPNVYGPRDHFGDVNSHVIPALIDKVYKAKTSSDRSIIMWGTGNARREFIQSEDLAEMLLTIMDVYDSTEILNTGTGYDVSISELVELIVGIVGFKGDLEWDTTKPDGMPRKLVDSSKMFEMGIKPKLSLEEGLISTYKSYVESLEALNPSSSKVLA